MKLRCSIWILWTTLACTTAPDIENTPIPPALSFVISSTGVYELEDTSALIWRNNDPKLTEQEFYFSYAIFACSELRVWSRQTIEMESTTKSIAFIYAAVKPEIIQNLNTHPVLCERRKKYHAYALPIIRVNDGYAVNHYMEGNPNWQEFSIGYEIVDDCGKLSENGLPAMERFDGLAKGSGWLETFKVVYDTEMFIPRQASYELNFLGSSETAPGSCKNLEVGQNHEFFEDISFKKAYRRVSQIGNAGSLSEVVRPVRPQSRSYKRANSRSPSGSPQNESKKSRLISQPERSPTTEDETYEYNVDAINEMELIDLERAPWDKEDYLCQKSLIDFNDAGTVTSSSKTVGESSTSSKRLEPGPIAFYEYDSSDEEYFVMQQLAPIEYFDVYTVQWTTCTQFNVVPMWRSLAYGPWQRVNQAIRKMLYVIDRLSIIAGTRGVLQLPKLQSPNQFQNVFLKSLGHDIAVPKLFYKFVVHKVPLPGHNGAPFSYGIIIVMHNEFGVPRERICPTDEVNLCSKYGWDVGSEDDEIARPYCCKPTPATLAALHITSYSSRLLYLDLNSVTLRITGDGQNDVRDYNQFKYKQYPVLAKKKGKTKKLNDIYF